MARLFTNQPHEGSRTPAGAIAAPGAGPAREASRPGLRSDRELPVLLIPPPKNKSFARQLKPRGTRQNPGVAPQNPIFCATKNPGFAMAGFLLVSCRAGGMGNLNNSGGRKFPAETPKRQAKPPKTQANSAFLAFMPVLQSKTGKTQPGAAPEHLKWRFFGF